MWIMCLLNVVSVLIKCGMVDTSQFSEIDSHFSVESCLGWVYCCGGGRDTNEGSWRTCLVASYLLVVGRLSVVEAYVGLFRISVLCCQDHFTCL